MKKNDFFEVGKKSFFAFLVISFFLMFLLIFGNWQILTGDEPRYLMYAYSSMAHGRFVMTLDEWSPLYKAVTGSPANSLPVGGGGTVLMNGVYVPVLLSPVAFFFKLNGLRFVALLSGLCGLFFLLRLCRRVGSPVGAILSVFVAAFTIPLLPYLHLIYMEAFLFAMVCVIWDRLQEEGRNDIVTGLLAIFIPLIHMRGSVVAAVFFGALLWKQYRNGQAKKAMALAVVAFGALVAFMGLNIAVYGAITGPVNSARPPMPSEWFSVLSMQLFNIRHGLIVYAPVWLFGIAGLIAGAVKRIRLASQGLVLLGVAMVTGVGVNPGECWPARFWVLSVPMLAVGFCTAWELGKSVAIRGIGAILLALSLVNAAIFFLIPNAFLENRQTTATYQKLYDYFGGFNFGFIFPVEIDDAMNVSVASTFFMLSSFFVLFLVVSMFRRENFCALVCVLLIVSAFDFSRVEVLPGNEFNLVKRENGFDVNFSKYNKKYYIQFGNYWETWFVPPDLVNFNVSSQGFSGVGQLEALPANQVIPVSCRSGVRSIHVDGSPVFDFSRRISQHFNVYRSKSIILRLFPALADPC